MLSIRRFLLRDILALMALVVLGLGGLTWFTGWEILRQQAAKRLEEGVKGFARTVEQHEVIGERCASTLQRLFLATQTGVTPPPSHGVSSLLRAHPEVHRIRYLSERGVQVWLRAEPRTAPHWKTPQPEPQVLQVADREALDEAAKSPTPRWIHGQAGRRDPAVWASYRVPIQTDTHLMGLLSVEMDAVALSDALAHSAPHPAMGFLFLAEDGLPLIPLRQDPSLPLMLPGARGLMSGTQTGPMVIEAKGDHYLLAHHPIPGKSWQLAVSMPVREFDREYRRFRILLLSICGALFLLLAWRTLLLARRFRTPLRQLAEVTRLMEAGQVPPPIPTEIREVRRLSETITRAAETMQRQVQFERNAASTQRLELMGSLAGGIAHDVNNHLTAIMGQLGLARDGFDRNHPTYLRMERAEEAALRCSDMIRALLNFSGRTPSEVEAVDLNQVVTRSADLFERLLGGRIRLDLKLLPSLPRIKGSRVNLEQVLMNLAVNARDAMPEGGTLQIETSLTPEHGVQVRVSDTGRGIPSSDLPHIFEPFFTTKAPEKGSGLGLAMVDAIIREQGGRIAVETKVGHGTSFLLSFEACPELSNALPKPTIPLLLNAHLEGRRILVVEDEPNLRELLCETFLKSRALVASAPNGAIAWHMVQESRFDLIFTDQRMPELTGLQLIERLRVDQQELPVILASGFYLEGPELERIGRDPHLRFLAKPFQLPSALNLVTAMLRTADLGSTSSV